MAAMDFSDEDLATLSQAKAVLEHPGLAIRLANVVGKPFDRALRLLPPAAHAAISRATDAAVRQCLKAALRTLDEKASAAAPPRNDLHKFAVGLTGALGGAFGLAALAVELPVTTTLMFRSICDIARSQGEDLQDTDTRLECLTVLALGGPTAADDDAETGYFAVRAALAEMISQSASELAARGVGATTASGLLRLVNRVAERFSVQVSQQVAAKSIPVVGAVLGATVNTAFMEHFQRMAQAHFTVRRLERQYGPAAVAVVYDAL
ncbi:MAG TPA: EcsC family protein [Rhodocyclaceae bacterium]|nr:EcsC family protein [Rhodocyclaceae bacterium]